MFSSLIILTHICSAVVGVLSGFLAMSLRKGSGWHGAAGSVFFVSMLTMSSSAAYIAAFLRPNTINLIAGLLTLYLVVTGWNAARRRDGRTGAFDRWALLFILAVGVAGVAFGIEAAKSPAGTKDGIPAAMYFVFGSVALLHAVSDARMLSRGGVAGVRRIARHLWRMSFALLFTALSFYPGQARLFPTWLRETNLLFVPSLLLVGAMVFYLIRFRTRRLAQRNDVMSRAQSELLGERGVRA